MAQNNSKYQLIAVYFKIILCDNREKVIKQQSAIKYRLENMQVIINKKKRRNCSETTSGR